MQVLPYPALGLFAATTATAMVKQTAAAAVYLGSEARAALGGSMGGRGAGHGGMAGVFSQWQQVSMVPTSCPAEYTSLFSF